jgi:hypothetical protein
MLIRTAVAAAAVASALAGAASEPLRVGTERQLFVDRFLVERMDGVDLQLHSPVAREVVLRAEKPWEGKTIVYPTVFRDGDRYRLYYRASGPPLDAPPTAAAGDRAQMLWSYTAVAESRDGIAWTRPELGFVDFQGSRQNNLVWPIAGHEGTDLFPFRDENPDARPDERYKALANRNNYELLALGSPDGLRWHLLQKAPVIAYPPNDPMMDPPNLAFWDPAQKQYVAYLRGWVHYRIRSVRRSTSRDFRTWTPAEFVDMGPGGIEHLYTNMATPYERGPGVLFMFAKRFVPWRKTDPTWPYDGLSEIVLLSSRDGIRFDRTFMEPFVRPGLDPLNWHERAIMMARGILQTSPTELSLYYFEHYRTPSVRLRRATLRPDGFVSITAPYRGGELVTRPLVLEGSELEVNFSTSAAGSIRVEVLDAEGTPIPGFTLDDCDEIFGDELERVVTWRPGHREAVTADRRTIPNRASELGLALRGRIVKLRFVMKAAELYSFRFR